MKIRLSAQTSSRRGKLADTMVEVVMGVALVGVVFVSLFAGMATGFSLTQTSRENLRATQIMLERMEGIRLFNWNQLVYSNWIPAVTNVAFYPLTNSSGSTGIVYTVNTVVTNAVLNPTASYSTNMRAITVTVTWTNSHLAHTRTMTTYSALNGMQNYVFAN